jgi:hypothetical protein
MSINPFEESLTNSIGGNTFDLNTSNTGRGVRLRTLEPKHSDTLGNLLIATKLAIDTKYPLLNVKNIDQTNFIFKFEQDEYVLLATWNDWAPYCFKEDAFINSTNEKINKSTDKTRKIFSYKNLQTEKKVIMEVKDITIPDGKFFIILEELYNMINKLLEKYGPESEKYTLDMLKLLYGFPLNHETSKWWSFVLIPMNCIVRPALDKDPNKPVSHKFTKINTPNTYHEKWLKNWYEYMKKEYEKINTEYESNKDNPEVIKKLHVYPWTGNGYTLNWKNITRQDINLEDNELYGATEFITRSPELDKLSKQDLQTNINIYEKQYLIKGYTVYNCLINNIDLVLYNIETNYNKLNSPEEEIELFFGAKYCQVNSDKPSNNLIIYKSATGILWCILPTEIKYNKSKNIYYHTINNEEHTIPAQIINRYKYTHKLPNKSESTLSKVLQYFN